MSASEISASSAAYTEYLERFHRGLASCAGMIDWSIATQMGLPDAARREQRYHQLTRDLRGLGIEAAPLAFGTQADASRLVGCLYVLEGSVHGGGVIHRGLEKSGGDLPREFLRGFGADNQRLWQQFTTWLDAPQLSILSHDAASHAARDAFDHFLKAFAR